MNGQKGHVVAKISKSRELACGNIRDHGFVTEGLPFVEIGQMHLHNGAGEKQQGIPQGHRGVGKGRRVNDDTSGCLLKDPVDVI